ncbi:MAG: MoaD/ThiS family protein [Gudongella sp.]|nr:MoaD/ThiS family protein [Gudongella sp.]
MEVIVNKKIVTIPEDYKIIELLKYLNYNKNVAVFIDKKQLLLSEYENTRIRENNNIRIIRPLGGG